MGKPENTRSQEQRFYWNIPNISNSLSAGCWNYRLKHNNQREYKRLSPLKSLNTGQWDLNNSYVNIYSLANRTRVLKLLRSYSVPITDMYNFVSKCMHVPSFPVIYFTSFKPSFTFLPVKFEYIFLPGWLHWIVTKIKWMSECKKCFGNVNARACDNDSYSWWLSLHLSSPNIQGNVLFFALLLLWESQAGSILLNVALLAPRHRSTL